MLPRESQARLKARIWQSIAQSEIDLSSIKKEDLEILVDILTSEAMLEMDEQLGESWSNSSSGEDENSNDSPVSEGEEILWEGRPFLSVSQYYKVSNQRIHMSEGFFGQTHQNIELIRIQDLDYKQSFSERLFNLGDIFVHSHDPQTPSFVLKNVQDPKKVFEILRQAVRSARKDLKLTFQEEM